MRNYEYELKRSRRKTLSITLTSDNKITVRSPLRTPLAEIEKFVADKRVWLDKHITANDAVISRNAEVIGYRKILINGIPVPLTIGQSDAMFLPDQNGLNGGVEVKTLKRLKQIYLKNLRDTFIMEIDKISQRIGLYANSLQFKDYKSRWGCCDVNDCISFNYKLLMLPYRLREYVIVHELCHTVFHDHSCNFWSLVEKYLPDYKKSIKFIKQYSFVNRIY